MLNVAKNSRKLIHPDGSWEVMSTAVPGAGLTQGGDAVIDDFLTPVRGMFAPGDPKIDVKRTWFRVVINA